mmetsp:Transcript_51023/g.127957  ORF Transcript_51023/g.127957 Transcript_51023/m.127957 type:complete len:200 (-) Transcript_51023:1119-1718(-)
MNQPVHVHGLLLSNSMRSIHGLQVHLRIPVTVVQNYCVSRSKVNAKASGSCGQKEELLSFVFWIVVELFDLPIPVLSAGIPVDAAVDDITNSAIVLQDIEHSCHLAEEEHLRPLFEESPEQSIKEDHLASCLDDVLAKWVLCLVFQSIEEVRVITCLSKLHTEVQEPHSAAALSVLKRVNVLGQYVFVDPFLHLAQRNE